MATTYKTFLDDDTVTTKTLLHEYIPITSSVISSSTYGTSSYKEYPHGMFVTVYDYPINSSSANNLFDITFGYTSQSICNQSPKTDAVKKINIYNQMAQVLVGYDTTGSIYQFDQDGNPASQGDKYNEMVFFNFSRLLSKDEIKKGSFEMGLGLGTTIAEPFTAKVTVYDDYNNTQAYKENSPTGEYGILKVKDSLGTPLDPNQTNKSVGFVFYQAGIVAINPNIFSSYFVAPNPLSTLNSYQAQGYNAIANYSGSEGTPPSNINTVLKLLSAGSIEDIAHAFRHRLEYIKLNNTTELNSSIYFCRINHNDFNYSSNPTYLSGSQIRVKNKSTDAPISYITTVGLYSPDKELLAVAKLSEPLKKDPTQELILRVRLDF